METQIINYRNNTFAYREYGNKDGYPLLIQHGLIASIHDYQLFEKLLHNGMRLICTARPGYGDSSPYMLRDIAEWGDIVAVLTEKLRITECDILGMSSGAPYSYSIGYKLQSKVRNIFIFSGTPALFDETVASLWPYPINKGASLSDLEKTAKELFFANMSQDSLNRNDTKDSMKNNCFGIALDFKLRCNDWGFPLSGIKSQIHMQHGKNDSQVPFETARITSELLPNCYFEERKKGDHFSAELLEEFFVNTVIPVLER